MQTSWSHQGSVKGPLPPFDEEIVREVRSDDNHGVHHGKQRVQDQLDQNARILQHGRACPSCPILPNFAPASRSANCKRQRATAQKAAALGAKAKQLRPTAKCLSHTLQDLDFSPKTSNSVCRIGPLEEWHGAGQAASLSAFDPKQLAQDRHQATKTPVNTWPKSSAHG